MALQTTTARYRIADVKRRHFNELARQIGYGKTMEPIIAEVIAQTPNAIDSVAARLPKSFPAALFDAITTNLAKSARQLEAMPRA